MQYLRYYFNTYIICVCTWSNTSSMPLDCIADTSFPHLCVFLSIDPSSNVTQIHYKLGIRNQKSILKFLPLLVRYFSCEYHLCGEQPYIALSHPRQLSSQSDILIYQYKNWTLLSIHKFTFYIKHIHNKYYAFL